MRFLDRQSMLPPDQLSSKRVERAKGEVAEFISQSVERGETRRTPSTEWMYSEPQFVQQMHTKFNGVCAYCEQHATLEPNSKLRGVVGTHRPNALAEDEKGNTELVAYAWLSYEWENLLWICTDCARRKGNRFYVRGERGRPEFTVEELRDSEKEQFLDPFYHVPSEHLAFHLNGQIKPRSALGNATSEILRLNSPSLIASRQRVALGLLELMAGSLSLVDVLEDRQSSEGKSSVLLARPDEKSSIEHTGAVTHALIAFGNQWGLSVNSAETLIVALQNLDETVRTRFLGEAANVAESSQVAAQGAQLPRAFGNELFDGADRITAAASSQSRPTEKPASRVPNVHLLKTAALPISNVRISNFKALGDISFDLSAKADNVGQSPCMILLGENATGKSSVLEAMALAIIGSGETNALNGILNDEDLSPNDLAHRPDRAQWDKPAEQIKIGIQFLDTDENARLNASSRDVSFSGSEFCSKVVLGYGPRRYFTKRKSRRLRAPANRVKSLFDPLDMIANPVHWLSGLKNPQFYAAARALREILMLENEDDFERDTDPNTRGEIFIRHNGQRTAMMDLSVGYKSIIAMSCDIIRELLYHYDNLEFAHAVVFVDEIETHLHPRWKMQIMQLLRKAFPKVQFIVTTHDPLCLRGMHDGEVFVLQRAGADSQVETVQDLPSINGMRAEQLLTSEFFGLGSTDPETDAQLARYNILVSRIELLNEQERAELKNLGRSVEKNMVLGSSTVQQAYAQALKESVRNSIQPTDSRSPRRQEIKERFASIFEKGNSN